VLAGLHTAMQFGAPTNPTDRATFVMPRTYTTTGAVDESGVPYDPEFRPTPGPLVKRQVACAVEYYSSEGKLENLGLIQPSRVTITLLDPDYQQIKGFEYVVIGGVKFLYRKVEPPLALGTLDVWTVHATAEDES